MDQTAQDMFQLRDHIADFDDFFRPIRSYLYWEPHCFDIPVCQTMRSIFDGLDGIDTMTDDIQRLLPDMHQMDALMPQMVQLMGPTVESMKRMRVMMLTMQATQAGQQDQMEAMQQNQSAMGDAFNDAHNDDTFYLPPEIFDNADFKRGMKNFISPDGHAVRFIISHEEDPLSADGIKRIDAIKAAVFEAIKGTPLEGSKVYLGGTASAFKDMEQGNKYDLMIAGVAALTLIFIIMLLITRAIVAAAVIVGTVVMSLGASFGMSVLLWQHLLGMDLQFMVMAMAVIILLAVGADYNLLLVARMKEELPAGINTGIIRAMGGSGSVVTAAGLVFAFTMISMSVSAMVVIAQIGTTIGLGLLFDTLVDPGVHDAGDRGAAGSVVLVAAGGAAAAGAGVPGIEPALRAGNRRTRRSHRRLGARLVGLVPAYVVRALGDDSEEAAGSSSSQSSSWRTAWRDP